MSEIVIRSFQKAGISMESLYELTKQSYQQWLDNGIEDPSLQREFDEFKRILDSLLVLVVQDAETGELVGMHCFSFDKKDYIYGSFLAVAPKMKHQGIATRMLQEEVTRFRRKGWRYMKENTSVAAKWSVNWHLKNGYRIIGYKRSEQKNHASYIFRKQLNCDWRHHPSDIFWVRPLSPITARICFSASYIVTCLCKNRSGRLNILGKMAKACRNKFSKNKGKMLQIEK